MLPTMLPRCYVASPLGFTEAGRYYYDDRLIPALESVVSPVDPWALTQEAEIAAAIESHDGAQGLAMEMGRRNARAIDGCQLLVAVLDGQEVDSGTASEVGYAYARGLPCLGLRSDLRKAGEQGAQINLQVEFFIRDSGGEIEPDLGSLLNSLAEFVARLGP